MHPVVLLTALTSPALACEPTAEVDGVVSCDTVVAGKLDSGDWPAADPTYHYLFGILFAVECPYGFDSFQLGSELGADCVYVNAPGSRCLSETCDDAGYLPPAGPGYWEQAGPEDIWEFVCPSTGTVELSFTDLDCDLDFMVLGADCNPSGGVITGSVLDHRASDSLSFECIEGETYYIVIEGFGFSYHGFEGYGMPFPGPNPGYCYPEYPEADFGHYTMTFTECPGEPEDCFNGIDDDGDGLADCEDPECECPELCDNGEDDDGDGFVDPDCGGTDCDGDVFHCCDGDGDLYPDECDLCPDVADPDQLDGDGDGYGDACDLCLGFDDDIDTDGDGLPDGCDDCDGADVDSDGDGVADASKA